MEVNELYGASITVSRIGRNSASVAAASRLNVFEQASEKDDV